MSFRKKQLTISEFGRPPAGKGLRRLLALLLLLTIPAAIPHLLAMRIPGIAGRPVDVVFVLSGGEGRIPAGYAAWAGGAARDLCILGAGRNIDAPQILPESVALPAALLRRIRVERWSENTLENAFSAKSIVAERGYTSALLVTSNYHVARAYLAFRKVLPPGVALAVLPVDADSGSRAGMAWRWARRHFLEGWKYWGYRLLLRSEYGN
jgi:uncharacterized SAM-binding protein YcdF (DUF218 family)